MKNILSDISDKHMEPNLPEGQICWLTGKQWLALNPKTVINISGYNSSKESMAEVKPRNPVPSFKQKSRVL